jgi:hypothetical protein
MLDRIQEDGYFYWTCTLCTTSLRSHVRDQAVRWQVSGSTGKGAVVVLPTCPACGGARVELKADYTLDEILRGRVLHWFFERGEYRGVTMELRHARSFRMLAMLYAIGKMPVRPILPVLPYAAIKQSALCGLPYEVVDSFFLPYALFGRCVDYNGIDDHIRALARGAGIIPLLAPGPVQLQREGEDQHATAISGSRGLALPGGSHGERY